jgi:hypothetical protein
MYSRVTSGNPAARLQTFSNLVNEPLSCWFVADLRDKLVMLGTGPNNSRVTLACQDGRVRMFALDFNNTVLIDLADSTEDAYFQVRARCSPCSYFLLDGVTSQPLLMMLAAAIKSLGIVLLTFALKQNKRLMRVLHSRYARCLTALANFRFDDAKGKEEFRKVVEGNFAPPVVDFDEVTRRLQRWISFKIVKSSTKGKQEPSYEQQELSEAALNAGDALTRFSDESSGDRIDLRRQDAAGQRQSKGKSQGSSSDSTDFLIVTDDEVGRLGHASVRSFVPSEASCFASTPEPIDPLFVEFYYTKLCEGQAWIVNADNIAHEVCEAVQDAYTKLKAKLHEDDQVDALEQTALNLGADSYLAPTPTPRAAGRFKSIFSKGFFSRKFGFHNTRRSVSKSVSFLNVTDTVSSPTDVSRRSTSNYGSSVQELDAAEVLAYLTAGYRSKFTELRHKYPASFEYVLLPNRILDNRLAPLPFVISFNIMYCAVFLVVCIFRVVGTDLPWFDRYQVVFYLFFNSTAIGSLVVDCFMRPLLLRRDLKSDPYIRVAAFFVSVPFLTHCLPGAVYYAWIFIPLIGLPIAFETWLRHKQVLTQQRYRVLAFTLRSTARIVLVFATCTGLSMSYNYAAIGIWRKGDSSVSSLRTVAPVAYADVPVSDFESRSFDCMVEEWLSSTAAFLQHFGAIIGFF